MSSTTPRETVHELGVLDTFISYRATGTGSPIVFLHGTDLFVRVAKRRPAHGRSWALPRARSRRDGELGQA